MTTRSNESVLHTKHGKNIAPAILSNIRFKFSRVEVPGEDYTTTRELFAIYPDGHSVLIEDFIKAYTEQRVREFAEKVKQDIYYHYPLNAQAVLGTAEGNLYFSEHIRITVDIVLSSNLADLTTSKEKI